MFAVVVFANKKLDFKIENLFRTCSVATNLVKSLDFQPIPCATLLCYFGQTLNDSVATPSFFLCSTATSSTTGGYVILSECFGQIEEPVDSNKERSRKKLTFVPKSRCNQYSKVSGM